MLERFCPTDTVSRIEDLDLDDLRRQGVRGLLLDLDNTLTPWRGYEMTPECEAWIARARESFRVCLLSNALSGRRVHRIAERLGVPCVHGLGPWGKPYARAFHRALRETGTTLADTVMIGDQLFTDIWGARRLGMRAILVSPIAHREFFATRWNRRLAALVESLLRRRGQWPDHCSFDAAHELAPPAEEAPEENPA